MQKVVKVAIVGGGVSGLSCATRLLDLLPHAEATVFDMGRSGPGGRGSTRRREGLQFDHGCQFVRINHDAASQSGEAASAAFRSQMDFWVNTGALAKWDGSIGMYDAAAASFTPRGAAGVGGDLPWFCNVQRPGDIYVGAPGIDALCHSLAARHPARLKHAWGTRVQRIERSGAAAWELEGTAGPEQPAATLGTFDSVVLSDSMAGRSGSPGYIQSHSPDAQQLLGKLHNVQGKPRLALMLALPAGTVTAPFDGAAVCGSDVIEWLANDSSKPCRPSDAQCWVAVSTQTFAEKAIAEKLPLQLNGAYQPADHSNLATVTSEMLRHVAELLGQYAPDAAALRQPLHASAQRWGSALYPVADEAARDPGQPVLTSPDGSLFLCGDWLAGSEVQRVVMLAHATAEVLAHKHQ